jgi:WXXGXW repeat (2 copies)
MLAIARRAVVGGLVAVLGGVAGCAYNPPPDNGVAYVERRPPPARREVIGVAPGRGFLWIGGFWRWGGADFVWVPGRWERPPRDRRGWEHDHWRHTRRGWYWVEGHWR